MFDHQDESAVLRRFRLMRDDPWEFFRAVRTLDPADKKTSIKPFPMHLEYLKLYVRTWMIEPKILVPKSRRMKISWVNIALFLWDAMFHAGRHNALVSKKEDDSNELIKRALFIVENLDADLFPRELRPKHVCTFNKLEFPEINSVVQGFPSGADQLRQFTFSGIMADEMAFWELAMKMYSASLPTLEGGGRFTGISSPAPGFFKRLVFDELDNQSSSD